MITFDKGALPANIAVLAVTIMLLIIDWRYALAFFGGASIGSVRLY